MQVRAWLRCAVATIDSNSCLAVMSQILPLSSIIFLPFLTSIELHQEMTILLQQWSIECPITKPTLMNCSSQLMHVQIDNCTLLVHSINTDCSTIKFMKLGESQNCFHKHIIVLLCELWWILSSAVYYYDRECYCFIINMLFSVPGYLYDHAQGVCFLPLLYTCNSHSQTLLYIHSRHSSSNCV